MCPVRTNHVTFYWTSQSALFVGKFGIIISVGLTVNIGAHLHKQTLLRTWHKDDRVDLQA